MKSTGRLEIFLATARSWYVTRRLGEISVLVLIVGGTCDQPVPPDPVHATASGISEARLVFLPGRGYATVLLKSGQRHGPRYVGRGERQSAHHFAGQRVG
ncbi:hypothetical protein [Nonomuraea sp. NPDC003709]|uniref:alpha/beta fold hydrolase n=1 Tax=Nonomuraea sp. NPDC003709 TaxID=3154450 RepID=UPI0033BC8B6F